MRELKYIILHHSGTSATNGINDPDGKQIFEAICRNHHERAVKEQWLINYVEEGREEDYIVDYHYLIGPTGKVFEGQPIEMVGYHCGNKIMNLESIGICSLGDFEKTIPPKLQVDALVDLIVDLIKKYKIPIENIKKHKDIVNTDCPGKYFPYATILEEVKSEMALKEPTEFDKAWDLMIRLGIFKPYGDLETYKDKLISRRELAVLLARLIEHGGV
jgi:hypothetical protein